VYDLASYYALIRELQPGAVIFGRGPDIRWIGNEKGKPRTSEWSVLPLPVDKSEYTWPSNDVADDLGSLKKLDGARELCWYPAETDLPNRKGFFYHAAQNDTLKSVDELLDCYYGAVGGNSLFLLNFAPDRQGLIPEADVARFREFVAVLKLSFRTNLAAGAAFSASASVPGGSPMAVTDGRPETFWTTMDWEVKPSVVVNLPRVEVFNVVMLQEHIESGQRVERFAVDAWIDGNWREIGSGTTIGYKKLLRVPEVKSDRVRVRFLESRVRPTLAEFGLFRAPARHN
jgi:alpha-L-fucosidase